MAYMTKYDSTHGMLKETVTAEGADVLNVDGELIKVHGL